MPKANARSLPEPTDRRRILGAIFAAGAAGATAALPAAGSTKPTPIDRRVITLYRRRLRSRAALDRISDQISADEAKMPTWARIGPKYVLAKGEIHIAFDRGSAGWPEVADLDQPPVDALGRILARPSVEDLDDQFNADRQVLGLNEANLSDANYRTLDDIERLAGHPETARDGRITVDQSAFRIRYLSRRKDAEKRIGELAAAGFLLREGDAVVLKDWHVRQYKSDSSTPRVQEHRAREREEKERKEAERPAPDMSSEKSDETLQETFHEARAQRRGTIRPPFQKRRQKRPYRVTEIQIDHSHL